MVPAFEIFRLGTAGPTWCGSAETVEAATIEIRVRAATRPAAYMVVSLKTYNQIVVAPDGSSSSVGQWNA
jgi:hypothetical protein